jgi:methanogenic corrinoid protein MtbC1/DNA-binding XRE family transcriptional regulator
VAQEHLATEITLEAMSRLRQRARVAVSASDVSSAPPDTARRAVVSTIEGDQHFVGVRMVADLLIQVGWEVDFLGPSTPTADLVALAAARSAEVVVVSATMPESLSGLGPLSAALKSLPDRPKLIVGGRAAQARPHVATALGADVVAFDATDAVTAARRMTPRSRGPNPSLDRLLQVVGRNIQLGRAARGLSQQELATMAELDRTYVSAVEHGKQNPTLGSLLRLAQALNLPITSLLTLDRGSTGTGGAA